MLANLLSSIKNAYSVGRKSIVYNSYSKLEENVLIILKKLGFIKDFSVESYTTSESKKYFLIVLSYFNKIPAISELALVSKPGCRVYKPFKNVPYHRDNLGVYVLSTSQGIMSDKKARRLNLGGEILFKVF